MEQFTQTDGPGAAAPDGVAKVRAALLAAFIEAAKSVELEPYRLLRQAGLAPGRAGDWVPVERLLAVLSVATRLAERPDFTLCVARAWRLALLGPPGLLARAQPTLLHAIATVCEYLERHDHPLRVSIERSVRGTLARLSWNEPRVRDDALVGDLGLGIAVRLVQELLGDAWRPRLVMLARGRPADVEPYVDFFGAVQFDSGIDAIVLCAEDLDAPLPEADAALASEITRFLGWDGLAAQRSVVEDVTRLIGGLLPRGACSAACVAEQLAIDRRTLHRRLALEGEQFHSLVERVRGEIVVARVKAGERSISQLAPMAGFSSLSAFSHWFRRAYGVSPRQFRQAGVG